MSRRVETGAHRAHASVHHVARAHAVGAGFSHLDCVTREGVQRRRQIDIALRIQDRAVTVLGRRAQAHVHPKVQVVAKRALDGGDGPCRVRERQLTSALFLRHREHQKMPDAGLEIGADDIQHLFLAEPRVVAEALNRLGAARAFDDEEGLHEMRGGEFCFGAEVTQMRRLPQPQSRPGRSVSRCHKQVSRSHCS